MDKFKSIIETNNKTIKDDILLIFKSELKKSWLVKHCLINEDIYRSW